MLDAPAPSQEDMELYQKYIDGEMEVSELLQEVLKKYKED